MGWVAGMTAALLTAQSSRPSRSTAVRTIASASAALDTSVRQYDAEPPSFRML